MKWACFDNPIVSSCIVMYNNLLKCIIILFFSTLPLINNYFGESGVVVINYEVRELLSV